MVLSPRDLSGSDSQETCHSPLKQALLLLEAMTQQLVRASPLGTRKKKKAAEACAVEHSLTIISFALG